MKHTLKLSAALAALLTVSAPSWGFVSFVADAQFCLVQCKSNYCASSQENFDACQSRCKGRYEGVLKNCRHAALAAGYAPVMLAAASTKDSDDMAGGDDMGVDDEMSKSDDKGADDDMDGDDMPKKKKKHSKKNADDADSGDSTDSGDDMPKKKKKHHNKKNDDSDAESSGGDDM